MANMPRDPLTAQPAGDFARPRFTTLFSTASDPAALFGLNADVSGQVALEHAARTLKHTLVLFGEMESGVNPAVLNAIAPNAALAQTLVNAAIVAAFDARLTREIPFFARGGGQGDLLATVGGVPINDTLEQVSCFLDIAHGLMSEAADSFGNCDSAFHASGYLMEFAAALVDSCLPSPDGTPAGKDGLVDIIERELADTAPFFGIHPDLVAKPNRQDAGGAQ